MITLDQLILAHREAWEAFNAACPDTDNVALKAAGKEPTRAAYRRWVKANRAEESALLALCKYATANDVERKAKVDYLLTFDERNHLTRKHWRVIVGSMVGRTVQ